MVVDKFYEANKFYETNRANWDDRARVHAGSEMYRIDEYATNPNAVSPIVEFDLQQIGSIEGLSMAHLQCHVGTDTLSLKRLGAGSVVGLDFSPAALEVARDMATRAGEDVRYVEASAYDAVEAIGHTVDFVYTGVGAICWLHDLDAWAAAVAGLLEPGGRFFIRDGHPFLFIFEEIEGKLVPHYNYRYQVDSPLTFDEDTTYSDNPNGTEMTNTVSHEWNHSLAEVINALVGAGMRIDRLEEHQGSAWPHSESCTREGDLWYLPEPLRSQVPQMFSLHASKL